MIHKFWNVKVAVPPTSRLQSSESPAYIQEEAEQNAVTLKEMQMNLEALVYRIWTQLSAFEESAAACISDTFRHVSDGMYVDAIRTAEKFVLHVEVLFTVIDELEAEFTTAAARGIPHVREARMLCSKIVEMFNLLSRRKDPSASSRTSQVQHQGMTMNQELNNLVTSLSHYKKVLIRNALAGALKLEREHSNKEVLPQFLDRFQSLKMDCAYTNAVGWLRFTSAGTTGMSASSSEPVASLPRLISEISSSNSVSYSQEVPYGYRSLRPGSAGDSAFSPKAVAQVAQTGSPSGLIPPTVACVACQSTIDEDCVRLGTYQRWHSHCIKCITCGKAASVAPSAAEAVADGSAQRLGVKVDDFRYEQLQAEFSSSSETNSPPEVVIYCTAHVKLGCRGGFIAVSRLEQYAFLLYVGVQRMDLILQKRGDTHLIASFEPSPNASNSPSYRYSPKVVGMKAWTSFDRKLSTIVHRSRRSTIVEALTGKIAQLTRA